MRTVLRYTLCVLIGLALGVGIAVWRVRSSALGSVARIGAWTTGGDYGTADAAPLTRAIVAFRGLLALPASEARYYNAAVDDAGRPLDGHCRYRVQGGALPAQWWSMTLYGSDSYLVANPANIYSVESAAFDDQAMADVWAIRIAPTRRPGQWLPTGGADRFELTLRLYLPANRGRGDLTAAQLPSITREGCS